MRLIHEIGVRPHEFEAVSRRQKTSEVCIDAPSYQVGDLVELYPWNKTMGRIGDHSIIREITFVRTEDDGPGLMPGHVMICFGEPS
ncbi:hypothetical protein DmGdi_27970 [Gluconobacter sp. Gdi]|nr:hypothetical protein DmGdi_27970 [Gluconobacter sp. Gdi]